MTTKLGPGLIGTALLALGCGSSLGVTVQRYDLDAAKCKEEHCGRRAFADARQPTPEAIMRTLGLLRSNTAAYGGRVKQLNRATQALMQRPINEKDRAIDEKVNAALEPVDKALDGIAQANSAGTIGAATILKFTANAFHATFGLEDSLRAARVVLPSDRKQIEGVMDQIKALNNQTLDKAVEEARKSIAEIPTGSCGGSLEVPEGSAAFVAWLPGLASRVEACHQALLDASEKLVASDDVDAIRRDFVVSQDMADPFLAFLAQHPEGWSNVDALNAAKVSGDGDTEFVLVLERTLDGRWKSVTVDPTKVLRARMRIGRSVAFAAAALGGAASGGIGIALPKSAGGDASGDTDPSVAKVASDAEWLKLQNAKVRSELARTNAALVKIQAELQNVDPKAKTDTINYTNLRAQLERLLVGFVPATSAPTTTPEK